MLKTTILVKAKIQPPQKSRHLVSRLFLLQKLNQNPNRTFTLVSAPAGFGKTTLIASWLVGQSCPYAWISLDRFDNDLTVLLKYVVTAVCQVFPGAFPQLRQVLQVSDLPGANELTALVINEMGQLPRPLLLVLDDYHLINNPAILQLWERLLTHPQRKLHLIIISRMDPLLPLARLRLHGMVEIRQKDLQFSDDEVATYLQTVTDDVIADDVVSLLNGRLEGWIAGLCLLVMSLDDFDQVTKMPQEIQFRTRDYISQYLFSEVFAHQESDVQEFLLRTAFVDRFCPGLGDAFIKPLASKPIIEYLQHANMFVIPLDEDGVWFRYHHLFQQMLQQKALLQFDTEALNSLHNRAGDWLAENGFVDEALQHYLDAGNLETAVFLIEAHSKNLLNGLARQRLERWMSMLPEAVIWEHPRLLIARAWLFYRHGRLRVLANLLERIQSLLEAEVTVIQPDDRAFILGQVSTFHSVISYFLERDFKKSIGAAKKAVQLLPPTEHGALGTALGFFVFSLQAEGEYETAVSHLQKALKGPAPNGPSWIQLYLGLCLVHLLEGNLLAMNRTAEQFLSLAAKKPVSMAAAGWVAGIVRYETSQFEAAREAYSATTALHFVTNFTAACDSWLGLVRICQEQGDLPQAQQYLDVVQAEALRLNCADLLLVIEAVQAYQWHLEGRTAASLRWASAFDLDATLSNPLLTFLPFLFWVRILVAHGDDDDCRLAQNIVQEKLAVTQASHDIRREIQLWIHLVLLEDRLENPEAAQFALQQAVLLAEPGGFIRSFVDCGSAIKPYLAQLKGQCIAEHYIDQLLEAFPAVNANGANDLSLDLLLTSRESEILQMMAAGQSNKEIARDLVISLYTVKRHASNIYRKLDVNGRREAVLKATGNL